jgi:hypothetical protein
LYDEYDEPQSPCINIANDDPREDPGTQSRVSRDPIPLFFLSHKVIHTKVPNSLQNEILRIT